MSIANAPPPLHNRWPSALPGLPGLALAAAIALVSMALRAATGLAPLNPLILAMVAGVLIGVVRAPGPVLRPGLALASRPVMRAGIVLLGFQVTLGQIADLGPGALAVAAMVLAVTYVAVRGLGRLLGVPRALTALIGAGTAVCGASAIIAANSVVRADDEDAAYAVACVTIFGTIAMLAAPLLAGILGLTGASYGIWAGATIHEVSQVTAAAFQLGPEAGQAGTVTKLMRVMMLAPLVLVMALASRRMGGGAAASAPIPWFVFGFAGVVVLNSLITLPPEVQALLRSGVTLFLAMGLAAMGLAIQPQRLRARGLRPLMLAALATVVAMGTGLGLILGLGL